MFTIYMWSEWQTYGINSTVPKFINVNWQLLKVPVFDLFKGQWKGNSREEDHSRGSIVERQGSHQDGLNSLSYNGLKTPITLHMCKTFSNCKENDQTILNWAYVLMATKITIVFITHTHIRMHTLTHQLKQWNNHWLKRCHDFRKLVITLKICHDVRKFVMTLKNTWKSLLRLHHHFKKFVMMSQNKSWRQK